MIMHLISELEPNYITLKNYLPWKWETSNTSLSYLANILLLTMPQSYERFD
jgi:hypothetical protein